MIFRLRQFQADSIACARLRFLGIDLCKFRLQKAGLVTAEISAYIGFASLLQQVGITVGILILLLACYFLSTWLLFAPYIPAPPF